MIMLNSLLENIYQISIAVLLLCSFFTIRLLKKIKCERTLSFFEYAMYILIRIAIFLWLSSYFLFTWGIF
ncbi:hypothetical protein [Lysinibacillus sphaericus]|uniref:hypothetical protein n=1 Tax=Lysinibacillus sphaericus TaxID=1421 RepID=UPI003D35CA49